MNRPVQNKNTRKVTRKPGISFTAETTLDILKLCVHHNTFDVGSEVEAWKEISDNLRAKFSLDVAHRNLKAKLKKLLSDYKSQQFKFKIGTEEENNEFKTLLEILMGYEDAGNVNDALELEIVFGEEEIFAMTPGAASPTLLIKKEMKEADAERNKVVGSDFAPHPTGRRNSPLPLSIHDQMIKQKQENDHAIEEKKLELKERKRKREFDIEGQRIELEKEKLKVMADENRRRDEIQLQQLELQRTMCELLQKHAKN